MDYKLPEPRVADQELYSNLHEITKEINPFEDNRIPLITIVDYPCGLGKTNTLLSILKEKSELKVLVVVQTLSESDRIVSSLPEGRIYAPEKQGPNYNSKTAQLEQLVHQGVSIVITHSLYEKAGKIAIDGGFEGYHVIIDEVPNAVSVIDSRLDDVSFKEFYLDRGYFSIEKDGLVLATPEGAKEELRLKDALDEALIKKIKSRMIYYDSKKNFIEVIPTALFTHTKKLTVLTFLSEGSLFLRFLIKCGIQYEVIKSTNANKKFKHLAAKNLSIKSIKAVNDIGLGHAKQTTYPIKSKEVKSIRTALKNLKQRTLKNVAIEKVIITCAKKNWYKKTKGGYDLTKPGIFSTDSRMFKGANWIPNTTRGTNNYSHCSHAIYLYEQNVNPILLNWLNANNKQFKTEFALTEMIQWIWRTRIRNGEPVEVYMPSLRMREIIADWISEYI